MNRKYYRSRVRKNLRELYEGAIRGPHYTKSLEWYPKAHQWCEEVADGLCIDKETVAGVVSALSPNNKWERNLFDARQVIDTYLGGGNPEDIKVCTYTVNKEKAFRVLEEGLELFDYGSGPKTFSFMRNIGHLDDERVTIDMWHLRACHRGMRNPPASLTLKRYREIEELTKDVAKEYGVPGYALQSVIWEHVREV